MQGVEGGAHHRGRRTDVATGQQFLQGHGDAVLKVLHIVGRRSLRLLGRRTIRAREKKHQRPRAEHKRSGFPAVRALPEQRFAVHGQAGSTFVVVTGLTVPESFV